VLKPHEKGHGETIVKRGGGKHKHDEHGGAWKVAFADFCLALMCLFLVLWLMAARNTESLEQVLTESDGNRTDQGKGVMPQQVGGPRGSLIERFQMPRTGTADVQGEGKTTDPADPSTTKVNYQSPEDLKKLSDALTEMSKEAGLAPNLESIITPYGLRVMMHDTDKQGMFVRGSAVPTGRFAKLLKNMGPLFAKMENQMLIVGHTDSSQYADTSYFAFSNWNLSSNRAMAARAQLLLGTMPTSSVLQVVGMADRAPLNTKNAAASENRRIELLILTTGQAEAIKDMFGMPGEHSNTTELGQGIDAQVPDAGVIQQLRDKLAPKR